jgi:hypothetical protein
MTYAAYDAFEAAYVAYINTYHAHEVDGSIFGPEYRFPRLNRLIARSK